MQRADATKSNMRLTAFEGAKVRKKDVDITKLGLVEITRMKKSKPLWEVMGKM